MISSHLLNKGKHISLFVEAMPFITSQHGSIESLILLDPRVLMEQLHVAIATINDDKQTYARTHSTGFIRASQFVDLLEASPYKHLLLDFFESCGLIFKKPSTPPEAGDQEGSVDLFIPLFALQPSVGPGSGTTNKKDWVLYLR